MSLDKINPKNTISWKNLDEQKKFLSKNSIEDLFINEDNRLDYLSIEWDKFDVDFSKNLIDKKTFHLLLDLA